MEFPTPGGPPPGGGGPLPSQEGKQEGSLYPVFTLTRFDSMLEAALFVCIIGLAGGHCWVYTKSCLGGRLFRQSPRPKLWREESSCHAGGLQAKSSEAPARCGSRGAALGAHDPSQKRP